MLLTKDYLGCVISYLSHKEKAMKKLENCQWKPRWVAHLGAIKGCLEYLGIDISDAWLFGGTGHAFVINLHKEVCPSGPTAWRTVKLFELGKNLGYKFGGMFGFKNQDDFQELQKRAWEHCQDAINQGIPCYGWELEIPEFYVVYGYDEVGYYYSGPGCVEGKGPKPWQELGDTGIGVLELYSVWPGKVADDVTTVKQALSFAVEFAGNSEEWISSDYKAGLEGFDNWINALQEGKASDMGTRYNTGVWLECRQFAVGFLEEAKKRLSGQADTLFDKAIVQYKTVSDSLEKVSKIYPWSDHSSTEDMLPVDDKSAAAIEMLQQAKLAEGSGLEILEKIVTKL
jgi:hypothetical protein